MSTEMVNRYAFSGDRKRNMLNYGDFQKKSYLFPFQIVL